MPISFGNVTISSGIQILSEVPGQAPWSDVSLLMNTTSTNNQTNNVFLDSSTNNFTVTRNGTVTQGSITPFTVAPNTSYSTSVNGGSGYFNGSTDFLTLPSNAAWTFGSTGDFTLELWVNSSGTGQRTIISNYNSYSTGFNTYFMLAINGNTLGWHNSVGGVGAGAGISRTITANTWNHVAVVRSGAAITMYVNGVSAGSITANTSYTGTGNTLKIGGGVSGIGTFLGYLSGVRVVNGTAVYTANFTPPTSPLTAISGTSLLLNFTNAGIYDAATKNNLITIGDAKVSTTQAKFGTTSVAFDGTGDRLQTLNTSDLRAVIDKDFTAEMWVYPNASQQFAFYMGFNNSTSAGSWIIRIENFVLNGRLGNADLLQGSVPINQWSHIALTKSGSTVRLFLNGALQTSGIVTAITAGTMNFTIGDWDGAGNSFNGFMQDIRITNGVARYTANFTPPTQPFPTN